MNRSYDDILADYQKETDLKRLDALLIALRAACAELDHAYSDQGVCSWCGDVHYSIKGSERKKRLAEADIIVQRLHAGPQPGWRPTA